MSRPKKKILQKNINNLEAYPYINKVMVGRSEGEKEHGTDIYWHIVITICIQLNPMLQNT